MATASENNPRKKKKPEPKEVEDNKVRFQLIRMPGDEHLRVLTEICLYEQVWYTIQTHSQENNLSFYTITFKTNDRIHRDWIMHLVKAKVYQGANFICD